MQQRRAPVSLGGVTGSQLRMYLGFGVLFPENIQEWGAQIPLISHGVSLGASAFISSWWQNRSDQGSCKSFGSTTQMFRVRWSDTIPKTEGAWWVFRWERCTTKPSIACTAWEWLGRGGAWLKCAGVCREVWLLVLACSALVCRHRWMLLEV